MKRVLLPTLGRPTMPSRSMVTDCAWPSPARCPRPARSRPRPPSDRAGLEDLAVLGREHIENEVGEAIEVRWDGPDADPEPGVVLPPKHAFDALEPVVAAGRAGAAEAKAAQGQGHVVHQDEQVAAGVEVGKTPGAAPPRRRSGSCRSAAGARGPGARSSCLRPPGRGRRGAAGPAASGRPDGRPGETRRCAGSRGTPGRGCPAPRWRAGLRLSVWSRPRPLRPRASASGSVPARSARPPRPAPGPPRSAAPRRCRPACRDR